VEKKERRRPPEGPFPAKVTPPKVAEVVVRPRLFELLEQSAHRQITWIVAPAGAGKTTIVADYLQKNEIATLWYNCDEGDADPATFFYYMREAARRAIGERAASLPLLQLEYVNDIEVFSRRFFESLSRQLVASARTGGPVAMVFDNFEDVPITAAVQAILSGGPEGLCDGARAIIVSREEPPAVLVRAQAGEQMALVDFSDLRFTLEETRKLVEMRHPQLDDEALERMHELTQGWAAGITLILAGQRHQKMADKAPFEGGFDGVMDYFAEEIFVHLEPGRRQFLLETSLLPTVDVAIANRLTGSDASQHILSELSRQQLFTKPLDGERQEYQYHPLLREFLQAKARLLYSLEQLNGLRLRAAQLLEEANQAEAAARLFLEAGDSAGLARMVKEQAQSLLEQGRNHTLEVWLAGITGEQALDPWIHFWRGFRVLTQDFVAARQHLQTALNGFMASNNRKGIYLTWAGLVDTYSFGIDDWRPLDNCIALFEELQMDDASFPDHTTELIVVTRLLTALTLVRMDQPALVEHWMERMVVLMESPADLNRRIDAVFAMSVYHLWRGAYEKNAVLLEKANAELRLHKLPPFIVLRIKMMVAVHCWLTAQYQAAYQAVDEGLELAAESGIHAFDSLLWGVRATAHLAQGELEQGASALSSQLTALVGSERTLDVYFYHINSAWYALLIGNPLLAYEHLQMVGKKVERIRNRYYLALWHLGMAQTTFFLDRPVEAMEHTHTALNLGLAMDSWVIQWYAWGVEAWLLLRQKQETEGLLALHRALQLGRRHRFIHLELFLPNVMRFLLTKALEEKIEPEYVRGVIRKVKLSPPLDSPDRGLALASLAHWPFRVRIHTLGRFEIQIQDEPLTFSGKEKKKPLEMLKVLIALGGVDVIEDVLADQLWPEADGDLAHKSLETTLSRLRKLLGGESSVLYRSHRITLNPSDCWVDCLALEQMLAHLATLEPAQATLLGGHALALCQGRFLREDTTIPCFTGYRERLRENLLYALLRMGRSDEAASDWTRAADHYRRAIGTDPLSEESYLRLMLCQQQMGNRSGAVRTYQRCEQNLRAGLGIEPSPEVRAFYRTLIEASPDGARLKAEKAQKTSAATADASEEVAD
jgi:ATP/maltotriose-dependent transcriptional regulator MalT/DNA-binding SARP family transcriptional activator